MEIIERVAPIKRHAAYPVRVQIIDYLRYEGESRIEGEITDATGVEQAVVSRRLRNFKDQGIPAARRDSSHVLYSVA